MDIEVTAEEMIEELTRQVAGLTQQLAAAQIIIRKLQANGASSIGNGVNDGQAHSQEEEQSLNGEFRHPLPEEVSN